MNPVLGWALAGLFALLAWQQYGGQGLVFAITALVFWLLLQFNRAVRVMKNAAGAPVGHIDSAVMLQAKLKSGMTLMQVIAMTKSIGRKVGDAPERFEWADTSGAAVTVSFVRGRCSAWQLRRAGEPAEPPAPQA